MSGRQETDGVYRTNQATPPERFVPSLERKIGLQISVAFPAIVTAYNTVTNRASITVGWLRIREGIPDPPRLLRNIPVVWPSSASSYITMGLVPGDSGWCMVGDRALQPYLTLGAPCDPIQSAIHQMHDAVFMPCRLPDSSAPFTVINGVVVDGPIIKLGANASLGVARTTDKVGADSTMTAFLTQAQVVLSAAAGFFGLPVPTPPTDFGIITGGSAEVYAK